MATVTIGSTTYDIPEANFVALQRAWPYIEQTQQSLSVIDAVGAGIRIVAACLMEKENFAPADFGINESQLDVMLDLDAQVFDQLNKKLQRELKSSQIANIRKAVEDITKEAGLVPEPGEDDQGQSPLTETLNPSSQVSLPPVSREEAGTV